MKQITKQIGLLMISMLFAGYASLAQTASATASGNAKQTGTVMKTYVIERTIPGAGQFTPAKLKDISKTSCSVLKEMGPGIQWIQSYVTENKIICVYKAENEDLLREHAKKGGFPIDAIYEVSTVISPATAN
jgi:hypothetical protein